MDDGTLGERERRLILYGDNLQQIDEFFDRDPGASYEAAQGSSIKLFMIGDGKMAAIGPVVDHVAARLVMKKKTDLLEGFGCFPTRDDGRGGIRRRFR